MKHRKINEDLQSYFGWAAAKKNESVGLDIWFHPSKRSAGGKRTPINVDGLTQMQQENKLPVWLTKPYMWPSEIKTACG